MSEIIVSKAMLEAHVSALIDQYAEGCPQKALLCGYAYVDHVESLAIDYARKLFDLRVRYCAAAFRSAGKWHCLALAKTLHGVEAAVIDYFWVANY